MAGTVSAYQVGTYTTPVEGGSLDASVVTGNDNTTGTKHNSHDADATIHVQSSALASRPSAGTAQRFWVTTDGLRAYLDSGSVWGELAYLPLVGGTMTGDLKFTDATYDIGKSGATRPRDFFLSRNATIGGTLGVTGATTLSAALTYGGVTLSNAVTGTGNMVLSASPTLTGTANFAAISASSTINASVSVSSLLGSFTGVACNNFTFTTSIASTTALATPGALSATQFTGFASTVSGATLMGYGTTGDVTLKNRTGTDVIVVTSNTTDVTFAGAVSGITTLAGTGAVTGFTSYTLANGNYYKATRNTSSSVINVLGFASGTDNLVINTGGSTGATSFSVVNTAAAATLTVTDAGALTALTSITATTGFGCNSKAAQTAYASGGALNAYGAGANGLDTGANMSALHALVVNIRAALVANGIMS